MTKEEIVSEIENAIDNEDRFVERFEELFGSEIISRLHLSDEKRTRIVELVGILLADSKKHREMLSNQKLELGTSEETV